MHPGAAGVMPATMVGMAVTSMGMQLKMSGMAPGMLAYGSKMHGQITAYRTKPGLSFQH
jgi:hypothetical protein